MSSISSRWCFFDLWNLFSFRSSAVVRELEGCLARFWFFTTAVVTREERRGAEEGGAWSAGVVAAVAGIGMGIDVQRMQHMIVSS